MGNFMIQKSIKSLQTNLIQNPGFETSTGLVPDNWDYGPLGTSAIQYPSTGRSGKGVGLSFSTAAPGQFAYWAQTVTGLTGSIYTLSGYIRAENIVPGGSYAGAYIMVEWQDSSGATLLTKVVQRILTGTISWGLYTETFTVPSGTERARITLMLSNSTGTANFDDISLIDVSVTTTGWTCSGAPAYSCDQTGGPYLDKSACQAECKAVTTVEGCTSGKISIPILGCQSMYLVAGGVGVIALVAYFKLKG